MSTEPLPTLTWGEIYNNYTLVTNAMHTINRSPSTTDQEFETKFEVQDRMQSRARRWGKGAQFSVLGGIIYFCLTSYRYKTKVATGMLYFYWFPHFYQLGSHLGLFLNLHYAADRLNMGEQYATGQTLQRFIRKVRERDAQRAAGQPVKTEQKVIQELYEDQMGKEEAERIFTRSYTQSNYFSKNIDKYTKTGADDADPSKIFDPKTRAENFSSDQQKLKFLPEALDVFAVRYVYHNTARWLDRLYKFVGLKDE